MRFGIVALVASALAGTAMAGDEADFMIDTAADLADLCATPGGHPNHSAAIHMCHGYLMGVHHMHTAVAQALEGGVYCIPAETPPTRNEVVADFVAWSGARPDAQALEAVDAVLLFAAETFPCP